MQKVLCIHDQQISDAPIRVFLEAKARLESTLRKVHTVSPIARRIR